MITRLIAGDRERIFDDEIGRFVEATAIPCHRCGVCCERWQPLVSRREGERLAAYLGLAIERFVESYTTPYPLDDAVHLLRREANGCVFLRRDESGRAACAVHPVRPDACAGWIASLDRRECVDGFARFPPSMGFIPITTVYPAPDEREAFVTVIGGERRDGD